MTIFNIISIFPDFFISAIENSIIKRAIEKKLCQINYIDLKQFGRHIDDQPYGGGEGMVIKANILAQAIDLIKEYDHIIYFSPRGKILNQEVIVNYNTNKKYIIICGRYEGIDQRVIEEYNIEEISLGNFILSCGEIPALCFIDSLTRLIPNVINNNSIHNDSFSKNYDYKIEYPLYTRPRIWRNRSVPEVLISGNHKQINSWKKENLK